MSGIFRRLVYEKFIFYFWVLFDISKAFMDASTTSLSFLKSIKFIFVSTSLRFFLGTNCFIIWFFQLVWYIFIWLVWSCNRVLKQRHCQCFHLVVYFPQILFFKESLIPILSELKNTFLNGDLHENESAAF